MSLGLRIGSASTILRDLLRAGGAMLMLSVVLALLVFRDLEFQSLICWTAQTTVVPPYELAIDPEDIPPAGRCSEDVRMKKHPDWYEDDSSVDSKDKGKRVALLFFGLPRSLPYTLPHIETNIIQPLRDAGYRPTVFLHTYNDSNSDARSREEEEAPEDWKALMPFKHTITNQAAVLEEYKEPLDACINWNWTSVKTFSEEPWDGWKGGAKRPNSENWLCQLQSCDKVGRLWEMHYKTYPDDYAAVAFLRPDVLYLDPFPVSLIPQIKPQEIYIPGWSGNGGINDRFAMFHPETAVKWKHRLQYTLTHCLEAPIHSESFTKDYSINEKLAIRGITKPRFVFFRVRGVGEVSKNDVTVPDYEEAQRVVAERKEELRNIDCW